MKPIFVTIYQFTNHFEVDTKPDLTLLKFLENIPGSSEGYYPQRTWSIPIEEIHRVIDHFRSNREEYRLNIYDRSYSAFLFLFGGYVWLQCCFNRYALEEFQHYFTETRPLSSNEWLLHSTDYSRLKNFLELQHIHYIYIDSDSVSNFSSYIRRAYDFKFIEFKKLDEPSVDKNLL